MSASRALRLVLAVVLIAAAITTARPYPASAAPLNCSTTPADISGRSFSADRHPLVGTHGWTGSRDDITPTLDKISAGMPGTFDTVSFDYSNANTDWAANPRIAQCLADFVNAVSQKHRDAGGDGRVFLVAHSMGGLAARFASSASFTGGTPIEAASFGGLVTFATPHQGSPFGGGAAAQLRQDGIELWDGLTAKQLMPDRTSDAARCLAVHDAARTLPTGCAYPPFLPSGIPVGQIAGDNTLRRTLFGQKLYDVPLGSDGVVSENSATGYLGSGPPGAATPRTSVGFEDVGCTLTTDETFTAVRTVVASPNVAAGIIRLQLLAIARMGTDSRILDQVLADQLGPELMVTLLAVAASKSGCNHGNILTEPRAISAAIGFLKRQLEATPAGGPEEVVLRPFTAGGDAAPGWTVDPTQGSVGEIDCSYPQASPASRSPGIQKCSPSAAAADACYFARGSTLGLCLQDPFGTKLVRAQVRGSVEYDLAPPDQPTPLGLVLDDGTECRLRNGGAWGYRSANPTYVGYYGCRTAGSGGWVVVWADPAGGGDGITRSAGNWTVEVGTDDSPLATKVVSKVYYVGTA